MAVKRLSDSLKSNTTSSDIAEICFKSPERITRFKGIRVYIAELTEAGR